jgi:hypothetical protein
MGKNPKKANVSKKICQNKSKMFGISKKCFVEI